MDNPFLAEARAVLQGQDRSLNVSRFSHAQIVEGLHSLVYERGAPGEPRPLRISHSDGSESDPFPVVSLGLPPEVREERVPLRLGFISGRHLELDATVDFYLVRNREERLFDCAADREQEVFERTVALFQDGAFAKSWTVHAYQTGLELMTVGFYRGLVEVARQRRKDRLPVVCVVPKIWRRRSVDLTRAVRQSRDALKTARLRGVLEAQVAALPEFLELDPGGEGRPSQLSWRLERPMWISERDLLCRRAPYARGVFELLYQYSAYVTKQPWGLG